MKSFRHCAAAAVILISSAFGAKAETQYCATASQAFQASQNVGIEAALKCTKGDTIVIPAKYVDAVARICDFSTAVVNAGGAIVCIVIGDRYQK